MQDSADYTCGYCGESSEIDIDPLGGQTQSYVEDCQVCCRPNRVFVSVDPETLDVRVQVSYEG